MSLSLFNALETLFDKENQPWFHRAQYGRFLDLKHINTSVPEGMKRQQCARSKITEGCQRLSPLGKSKNPHDMFISVELALYIAMRSDKENAKPVRKWLIYEVIPHGLNKSSRS